MKTAFMSFNRNVGYYNMIVGVALFNYLMSVLSGFTGGNLTRLIDNKVST